jgi:hypothetical protein
MLEIVRKKILKLRDRYEIASNKRLHGEALHLEGAILHMEMLYSELLAISQQSNPADS